MLLVIAYVGCITLFIAATIAITATDIKRVLAYSTVSQLGYMMLALGVGGWLAGTVPPLHPCLFQGPAVPLLGLGDSRHGHQRDAADGRPAKKMPWTACTMLVGCLAISGAGMPLLVGLSGYYSKDCIIAQALLQGQNPLHGWLF